MGPKGFEKLNTPEFEPEIKPEGLDGVEADLKRELENAAREIEGTIVE